MPLFVAFKLKWTAPGMLFILCIVFITVTVSSVTGHHVIDLFSNSRRRKENVQHIFGRNSLVTETRKKPHSGIISGLPHSMGHAFPQWKC